MSRIVDEPYFTYSAYSALTSGIQVKCPKCHSAGVVTADDDNAYFRCRSCGHQEARDWTIYRYDVHNQCKNCGRYYRVDIEGRKGRTFPFSMWPAPIAVQPCREKFIKQRRLSPILLIFRMDENLILAWSCGF